MRPVLCSPSDRPSPVWVLLLAIAFLIALALAGCAQGAGEALPDPADGDEESVALTADELAAWGMSVQDKQTLFAPGFPWQAPVIDGEILETQVDAAGTHLYRIEAEHPAGQVAEWYRRSYPNANWVLHDERTSTDGGTTTAVLEVTKGQGAWSRVLVEGDDSSAVVEASVGIGSPPEGVF